MTALSFAAIAVSVAMIHVPGSRIFAPGRLGGVVTAGLFALTPLLWLQARHAPGSLVPLPFVVGWLLAIAQCQPGRSMWWPAVAGAFLGAGVYTSYASLVMMPLFLLLTIAVAAHGRMLALRGIVAMVAVFGAVVSPIAVPLIRHPDLFRETVNAFRLYDANRFNLRQGVREMASWVGLTARSEVYYDYFNPAFLFLTGRVLLFPLAVLIPAGLFQILSEEKTLLARLSIAGFLAAPFAASLTAEAPTERRILFITPFAAMVAAYGLKRLRSWRPRTNAVLHRV
jgi:hypothetical protein